jgi:hypothetical protein
VFSSSPGMIQPYVILGWDLVEWLERCASILMITSSSPSGGSEFTFRSDLLLIARGGCTWALLVECACLPCYPGNTLCSQRLEPPGRSGIGAIQIPNFFFKFCIMVKLRLPYSRAAMCTLLVLKGYAFCLLSCVFCVDICKHCISLHQLFDGCIVQILPI